MYVRTGLAKESCEGYIAVGFTVLITCILYYLNKVQRVNPPIQTVTEKVSS